MRKPTEPGEDYGWWQDALDGKNPPLHDGEPHVGWYRTKKHKGGPWIPVVIWRISPMDNGELVDDESLQALKGTTNADPAAIWSWVCGYPITAEEYYKLLNGETENTDLHTAKPAFPERNPK